MHHNRKILDNYYYFQALLLNEINRQSFSNNVFFLRTYSDGLGFPNLPKALIPFFVDDKGKQWTAFEAQLLEALKLGNQNKAIPIHLTIDKENRAAFESAELAFREKLSKDQVKGLMVEYSYQHPLTDTPYLNQKNQWVFFIL